MLGRSIARMVHRKSKVARPPTDLSQDFRDCSLPRNDLVLHLFDRQLINIRMRIAMVSKIAADFNPLPKYLFARNLANIVDSFLNHKAGRGNSVPAESIQNCAINSSYFNWSYSSRGRDVGFRDRKVVKSDRHHALLLYRRQTKTDQYQQSPDDTQRKQNSLIVDGAHRELQRVINVST